MTPDDPTLTRAERVLAALPRYEPRQAHAERLRARCHRRLAKKSQSRPMARPAIVRGWRALVRTAFARARGFASLVAAGLAGRPFPGRRTARS